MREIEIKNTLNKKLKKAYQVIVPSEIIEQRIDKVVVQVQKNYKMKGFRAGQVPENLIKQKYEGSIMAEESEKIINENSKKIITENKLKLAIAPKVEIKTFEPKKDFEYNITMELMPEMPEIDVKKIKLKKFAIEVSKEDIKKTIKNLVKNQVKWNKQDQGYKAKIGDAVNMNYVGSIDKKVFDGGSANDYQLELGSKTFIDDFEEQLVGKKAQDKVKVKVRFPKNYHKKQFADKAAEFEVTINSVLTAEEPDLNDEFIKTNFGFDNLAKLEEIVQKQLELDYQNLSKAFFKKELFEFLNKKYDFELPSGLVEGQFNKIWQETEKSFKSESDDPKELKEQEKSKAKAKERDYEDAVKSIRSSLLFFDMSKKNQLKVSDEDVKKAISERSSQFPGQEQIVMQYYQENHEAMDNLKSIILEEKFVDFIIDQANLDHKKISMKDFKKLSKD